MSKYLEEKSSKKEFNNEVTSEATKKKYKAKLPEDEAEKYKAYKFRVPEDDVDSLKPKNHTL